MLEKLIRAIWFLIAAAFAPAGIGLKSVALALFVANPSWATTLCTIIVLIFVSVLLVTSAIFAGEEALRALNIYMCKRKENSWVRTSPFSVDELCDVYELQHLKWNFTREVFDKQLHLITYEGNVTLDCTCYFNIAGSTFILTPNATTDFRALPPQQRFVIYHELGHASLAGGELWTGGKTEIGTILLALTLAVAAVSHWPWWAFIFGIGGGIGLLGMGSSQFRNEKAETFADRYALKMLARDDVEQALKVARQLKARWSTVGRWQKAEHLRIGGRWNWSREFEILLAKYAH
jgi:hypothetical protein